MNSDATLQQAIALHQQNRLAEAERLYRAILQQQPFNAVALHNLGLIAGSAGHFAPAIEHIRQSIQLDPKNVHYRVNFIGLLDAAGQWKASEEAARQLVSDHPGESRIRFDYTQLLMKHGKPAEALREWESLYERDPSDFATCFHYASTLEKVNDLSGAEARYRDALKAKPDFGEAMVNLAGIMLRTERVAEACPLLEQAVKLLPNNATVIATLGSALTTLGRLAEGRKHAEAAARLAPRDVDVLRNLGYSYLSRGDVETTLRIYRQIVEIAPTNPSVYSTLLMTSLYADATGPEELALHLGYQKRIDATVRPRPAPLQQHQPGERLRVGYVSPDFRNHPVGHFIEPLLAHHDRTKFEIHCFSNSSIEDDLTRRIKSCVDGFHPVLELSYEQLDKAIRDLKIDILIDLAGHTGANCLYVFAAKPAPVQMTYLGYPHTSGLKAIDVRITDAVADPPGESDAVHSERLMRLPGSFGLFKPPVGAPDVLPAPYVSNGYFTFGTVSRIEKWTDAMLSHWAAVIRAVPKSRFRIMGLGFDEAQFRQHVLDRLKKAGIDSSRIELVGRKPFLEYLSEVSAIDLILDTLPFNGHTTTLQALYMGVPTVTLAGKAHRSRMGASVMSALGLPRFITHSREEFRRTAIELANDRDLLAELRSSLRSRLSASPLCDGPAFARSFEALLQQAWNDKLGNG